MNHEKNFTNRLRYHFKQFPQASEYFHQKARDSRTSTGLPTQLQWPKQQIAPEVLALLTLIALGSREVGRLRPTLQRKRVMKILRQHGNEDTEAAIQRDETLFAGLAVAILVAIGSIIGYQLYLLITNI